MNQFERVLNESKVLSQVLRQGQLFHFISHIPASAFSSDANRAIFEAIGQIWRTEQVTRVSVANELAKQGKLAAAGGLVYLIALDDLVTNPADFVDDAMALAYYADDPGNLPEYKPEWMDSSGDQLQ